MTKWLLDDKIGAACADRRPPLEGEPMRFIASFPIIGEPGRYVNSANLACASALAFSPIKRKTRGVISGVLRFLKGHFVSNFRNPYLGRTVKRAKRWGTVSLRTGGCMQLSALGNTPKEWLLFIFVYITRCTRFPVSPVLPNQTENNV